MNNVLFLNRRTALCYPFTMQIDKKGLFGLTFNLVLIIQNTITKPDVIYVNKDGSVEIKFKYNDEYLELLNYLKTEGEKEKCLNGELEYI